MNLNTVKTSFGFLVTLVERFTPLKFRKSRAESVFNYLALSDALATSGQPTKAQFAHIRQTGYETVINLLPNDHENSLPGQAALMEELGFNYVYIPVDFKNPRERDFEQFCEAMDTAKGDKVWVHCAANMRVSAFVYRYRVEKLGMDEGAARADMEKIWTPFGAWKRMVWPGTTSD